MDAFERRVSTAAKAAWQVVGIACGFLVIVWLVYLGTATARLEWMRALWGPDISWLFFGRVCLAAIAFFKFAVWMMAFAALFLTLWAKALRST